MVAEEIEEAPIEKKNKMIERIEKEGKTLVATIESHQPRSCYDNRFWESAEIGM
jgi:hypothetical protein